MTKPLVKCEVRFIYLSAVSFSPSQQSTKHSDDWFFYCLKSCGCFESQKKPREIEQIRNFLANHKMCLLNSVKSSRTRLFYQKSHRCAEDAEVRELRPRAQSFFCKKQFWDEGCCKLAAASAVGIVTQGAIAPQILTGIKGNLLHQNILNYVLLVHLDFQTFLRPRAIDGLWARLFWHLWMHVVFDSPADPTNLNKKESCSCSISPQSETCLPTTRHLFALCFRKMPVVEVCHMSTHKIWIQIHSKVHIFWEGHKILRNLHLTFDYSTYSQKLGEDFAKVCGLFRIYEL